MTSGLNKNLKRVSNTLMHITPELRQRSFRSAIFIARITTLLKTRKEQDRSCAQRHSAARHF
jgi:hypothetical protein